MKAFNNKGFVLVEVLIVTTFVLVTFVFIYQNLIPQMGEFEKMANYDDIDSIYNGNVLKKFITRYANTAYIDDTLLTESYININDCSNKDIYINSEYCSRIMKNLGITDKDYVLITDYDISNFRDTVNKEEMFDSGNLSNFRDYLNTVSNVEDFYNINDSEVTRGRYRLFISRTVTETDQSTSIRYANVGIYTGEYQKYVIGETINFDPGDGMKTFYVLKNSPSTSSSVTLISAVNLPNSVTTFNSSNTVSQPDTVLDKLKKGTESWTKVRPLSSSKKYTSDEGYVIKYEGYRARLLDEKDILEVLGCKEDDKTCFDYTEAFTVNFNQTDLSWLISNLGENEGYWTAVTIPGSKAYAWSIQKGKIVPTNFNQSTGIGVRPVITVSKDLLS